MLKRYKLWVARAKQRRGFTLVEVMAVMAIIAVLAVSLVPSIDTAMARSKDTTLRTDLAAIGGAVEIYKLDNGVYPADIKILVTEKYINSKINPTDFTYNAKDGIATAVDSRGKTLNSTNREATPKPTNKDTETPAAT